MSDGVKGSSMNRFQPGAAFGLLLIICGVGSASAQVNSTFAKEPAPSKAQQALDQAAVDQKFTFLVFYKDTSPAAKSVVDVVKSGVSKRADRATHFFVKVTDPAEQQIVSRFKVSRAPMPLTMVIAPNGAVTGMFPQKLTDANIEEAIVTPTMTKCMKSLQEGKLVFVCVQNSDRPVLPAAVKEFQEDPAFKQRVALVSMHAQDPGETRFLNQMQIDAQQMPDVMSILLAPPGVMIGKYDQTATKDDMAAALHKAGKCCDDPNCKHNHAGSNGRRQTPAVTNRPTARPTNTRGD